MCVSKQARIEFMPRTLTAVRFSHELCRSWLYTEYHTCLLFCLCVPLRARGDCGTSPSPAFYNPGKWLVSLGLAEPSSPSWTCPSLHRLSVSSTKSTIDTGSFIHSYLMTRLVAYLCRPSIPRLANIAKQHWRPDQSQSRVRVFQ
jgi:hypothetical protein